MVDDQVGPMGEELHKVRVALESIDRKAGRIASALEQLAEYEKAKHTTAQLNRGLLPE